MIVILSVTSCNPKDTIEKRDNLPILVDQLRDENKFDTILKIESEDFVYYFNKKKEYIGQIRTKNDEDFFVFTSIMLIIVLGILLIVISV